MALLHQSSRLVAGPKYIEGKRGIRNKYEVEMPLAVS
jgi:hypothetical protein